MHRVFFALKRADQAVLAVLRRWLTPFGITPARFDMLFVIANTNKWHGKLHWVYQSDIRRQLGVTAVTVCKMLRSLERLGLVRRKRSIVTDRRQVIVELTRKARGLLRRVHDYLIRPGFVRLAVYATFAMCGEDVMELAGRLDQVRARFRDRAQFIYPWCSQTAKPRKPRRARMTRTVFLAPIRGGSGAVRDGKKGQTSEAC